ncbi:MAG: putative short-chain dehydrogenase/oxidoreductase [Rhizobium sp.]|nr:putative short-chain dehydrogenase/oxidoreductase [Rhizobium sp.]
MSSAQKPIGSGFGAASTAADTIKGHDLSGKTVIVTGGYSGLGLETATTLLGAGAQVIVPARDIERAREALAPYAAIELEMLDLMDPVSIDAFADRFLASGRPLHILINNAAVMMNPLTRDSRGNESQFSTNHLGHFQLTVRLWPALKAAHGARVIALASLGHHFGSVDFDDPNFERRPYDPRISYGQSKTANVLFAVGADRRGEPDNIRAFALHPGGIVATNLVRHVPTELIKASGYVDEDGNPRIDPERNMKTIAMGAATTVWCAVSNQLDGMGGVYCEDCEIAKIEPEGSKALLGVWPYAIDPALAERLWAMSEEMTGAKLA